MRVIASTITDPTRSGYQEPHRVVTTFLNPRAAPALELVLAYHERWEIELTIDELNTHERLVNHPLRSKKPLGVIQEISALLLAHFVLRSLMYQAALESKVDPDRLSFLHTIRLVQAAIPEREMTTALHLPSLLARLRRDALLVCLFRATPACPPFVVSLASRSRRSGQLSISRAALTSWQRD